MRSECGLRIGLAHEERLANVVALATKALVVTRRPFCEKEWPLTTDRPYCFVLMPFGRRPDPASGAPIDFDRIFHDVLVPAIEAAGMHPHRDDFLAHGGVVQKSIFEALLLCEFAIADLTTGNANVLYELGIRHAVRPSSTLTLTAHPDAVPFDVRDLRTVRYALDEHSKLSGLRAVKLREEVTRELVELRRLVQVGARFKDSPLFQLVEGWAPDPPSSLRTDLFAERVAEEEEVQKRLTRARSAGLRGSVERERARQQVAALQAQVVAKSAPDPAVLVDVLLTQRALEDFDGMLKTGNAMPGYVRARALVQEQMAFALNRRAGLDGADDPEGDRDEAIAILLALESEGRGSAETAGLLGRVHKDRWRAAESDVARRQHLDRAVAAYTRGFDIDPRDPYPGINAAVLLFIRGNPVDEARTVNLLAAVEHATERLRRLEHRAFWSSATLLQIAVLKGTEVSARAWADDAVELVREPWELSTTATTLRELSAVMPSRGRDGAWIGELADLLEASRL